MSRKLLVSVFAFIGVLTSSSLGTAAPGESPAIHVISSTLDSGCHFSAQASIFTHKLSWLLVEEVRPDSVAYIAGLKPRDRIVTWNGIDLRGKDPEFIYTIRVQAKDRIIVLPVEVLRRGEHRPKALLLRFKDVDGTLEFVRSHSKKA